MRKRIKARVIQKYEVSLEFAREIYRKGKRLAVYSHTVQDSGIICVLVYNILYCGKLYFVVYYETDWGGDVKECIEL
jgi:hypothetical protein